MSLISQASPALDGGCAHGAFGRAGIRYLYRSTNLRTAASFRLVAKWLRHTH